SFSLSPNVVQSHLFYPRSGVCSRRELQKGSSPCFHRYSRIQDPYRYRAVHRDCDDDFDLDSKPHHKHRGAHRFRRLSCIGC
ncbi:hypothetical protein K438DRAFT_2017618, partial [Mycena galopus ATCC 62051]